jgi:ribosome-associated protein
MDTFSKEQDIYKYIHLHMNKDNLERDFSAEIVFRTSRSSGKGGQNVNKVSTRVELLFFIDSSAELTEEEKALVRANLRSRIRRDGSIHLVCQEGRSQEANRKRVVARFRKLMESALKKRKKRIPTLPGPEAEENRRKGKIKQSYKKGLRRKPGDDEL